MIGAETIDWPITGTPLQPQFDWIGAIGAIEYSLTTGALTMVPSTISDVTGAVATGAASGTAIGAASGVAA